MKNDTLPSQSEIVVFHWARSVHTLNFSVLLSGKWYPYLHVYTGIDPNVAMSVLTVACCTWGTGGHVIAETKVENVHVKTWRPFHFFPRCPPTHLINILIYHATARYCFSYCFAGLLGCWWSQPDTVLKLHAHPLPPTHTDSHPHACMCTPTCMPHPHPTHTS